MDSNKGTPLKFEHVCYRDGHALHSAPLAEGCPVCGEECCQEPAHSAPPSASRKPPKSLDCVDQAFRLLDGIHYTDTTETECHWQLALACDRFAAQATAREQARNLHVKSALLAALKLAAAELDHQLNGEAQDDDTHNLDTALRRANAAIAQAEEGK